MKPDPNRHNWIYRVLTGDWTRLDREAYLRAQGRIARWEARQAYREAGGPMLTLGQLDALIARTCAEAKVAEGIALGTILLRLEDMEREHLRCAFLGERVTAWPDDPAWTGQ